MLDEYVSFRRLEKIWEPQIELPKLAIPGPEVPRNSTLPRSKKKVAKEVSLESLLSDLQSRDEKKRKRAVLSFGRRLRYCRNEPPRPDLAIILTRLFYRSEFNDVRGGCVAGLSALAEPSTSPKPILDALSDADRDIVMQGLFACGYFLGSRGVEPLCRFIESGRDNFLNQLAMTQLSILGDPRAIPTLSKILFNAENGTEETFIKAGNCLGRCGPDGVNSLVPALDHSDPRIRLAAVSGIILSKDPRAPGLLERMKKDPDPRVRKRAGA
jgi:hypothetical protein